jgi:hypothetical protein
MVHRALCMSLLAASLGASLAAQRTVTVPPPSAMPDGTARFDVPFGRGTPARVQFAYDAPLFAGPTTLTAIVFEPDGADANEKTIDCELRLSTMPAPAARLAPVFAENRGADATVVLPRQRVVLAPRRPIALAVPFHLDPARGGLLLEIVVHGQDAVPCALAATRPPVSRQVPIGPASCPGSSGERLDAGSVLPAAVWGRPWAVRVGNASPGAVVLLAFGTRESGTWAGLQLPQELSALGAPGCSLAIDVAAAWYSVAGGDGSAVFPFVLPDANARGVWLRFQGASFDAAANRLGLVTSRAQKVQVCSAVAVGSVWSDGIAAESGTIEPIAAVIRLLAR